MISAEEAFKAWKNGEQVYWVYNNEKTLIDADTTLDVFLTSHSFELKPRAITINGIEVEIPKNIVIDPVTGSVGLVFGDLEKAKRVFETLRSIFK